MGKSEVLRERVAWAFGELHWGERERRRAGGTKGGSSKTERAWEYSSADGTETEGKLKRERIIKVATEHGHWGGGMGGDPVHKQRADPGSGVRETSPFP